MPPWKRGKNAPAASGRDGFDALPDGVLEHILGFLPAEEAVGTSVLARRWRHLWKSATGLRVMCTADHSSEEEVPAALKKYQRFVDHLMVLRGHMPLESFELAFYRFPDEEDMDCLDRWVEYAVKCQVRMLRIQNVERNVGGLEDRPLVSPHLTRLEMIGLGLLTNFSDFSSCPFLEHLEITDCYFYGAVKVSSQSLKRIIISNNVWEPVDVTVHLCVPSLVSLHLEGHFYKAPVFQSIPSLQDAFVRVSYLNEGYDYFDGSCYGKNCYTCDRLTLHDENNKCVLLEDLSQAEYLALVFVPRTFIFNMEIKNCPTFCKLKSLLLNDYWCVAPDFHVLTCILKHSPVLQKLTLQLSEGPQHKLVIKGRRIPSEVSAAMSGNLKIVEVMCEVADEEVFKIFKFLATLGIRFILDEVEISKEPFESVV